MTSEARYPAALLTVLLLWTVALGIAPHFRQDWLLENVLVLVSVPLLVATYKQLRFSNAAYSCLFAFFMLHELGAHYTYSLVPYEAWGRALLGVSIDEILGFDRNMFDRAVHFLYGVLITPAAVELLAVKAPPVGVWRFLVPLFFMNSHAVIYETVEWLAAEAFGGELGEAYLGTQGDVFDAQKDMALAFLGTLLALTFVLWRRSRATAVARAA